GELGVRGTPRGGGAYKGKSWGAGGLAALAGNPADISNKTPVKRQRSWASPSGSPRNAHCKVSFTIEGKTLIRSNSGNSNLGGAWGGNQLGNAGGGGGRAKGRGSSRGRGSSVRQPGAPRAAAATVAPSPANGFGPKPALVSTALPGFAKSSSPSPSLSPMTGGAPTTPCDQQLGLTTPGRSGGSRLDGAGGGKSLVRASTATMMSPLSTTGVVEGTPSHRRRIKPQPEAISFCSPDHGNRGSQSVAVSVTPSG
ncbi:unnamed protein product, partial [Discosporangium mesarthrocarpum]